MDYSTLPNTALIHLCGQDPKNRTAWTEFYRRFDERIRLFILRECRKKIPPGKNTQFSQIVQDLVQDVYLTLTKNEVKALRDFKGTNENSIYLYLGIIAKNTVQNHVIKMNAQKRPDVTKSIDEPMYLSAEKDSLYLHDFLHPRYSNTEEEIMITDLRNQIENILDQEYRKKNRERNKIIFKLYFEEGFTPENIVTQFGFNLSEKRITNLIGDIRNRLKKMLPDQKMKD